MRALLGFVVAVFLAGCTLQSESPQAPPRLRVHTDGQVRVRCVRFAADGHSVWATVSRRIDRPQGNVHWEQAGDQRGTFRDDDYGWRLREGLTHRPPDVRYSLERVRAGGAVELLDRTTGRVARLRKLHDLHWIVAVVEHGKQVATVEVPGMYEESTWHTLAGHLLIGEGRVFDWRRGRLWWSVPRTAGVWVSPEGRRVALAEAERVTFFDGATARPVRTWAIRCVSAVQIDHGNVLAVMSSTSPVKTTLFEMSSGDRIAETDLPVFHGGWFGSRDVAISPDRRLLAIADGEVRLFTLPDCRHEATLRVYDDGEWVASSGGLRCNASQGGVSRVELSVDGRSSLPDLDASFFPLVGRDVVSPSWEAGIRHDVHATVWPSSH